MSLLWLARQKGHLNILRCLHALQLLGLGLFSLDQQHPSQRYPIAHVDRSLDSTKTCGCLTSFSRSHDPVNHALPHLETCEVRGQTLNWRRLAHIAQGRAIAICRELPSTVNSVIGHVLRKGADLIEHKRLSPSVDRADQRQMKGRLSV